MDIKNNNFEEILTVLKKEGFCFNDSYELFGNDWCLGGTWGSYTGNISGVSPEPQPNFDAFDEVMLKMIPNCSYMVYKKIYRECVTIREKEDYDYYGGMTTNAVHVCDMRKLIELIKELD